MTVPVEIEIKFRASLHAFKVLGDRDAFGSWHVIHRETTALRDSYFDLASGDLGAQRCTLRVRQLNDASVGELTLKAPAGSTAEGIFTRTELTVGIPATATPVHWLSLPETAPVRDALRIRGVNSVGSLVPVAILVNPRRDLILRRGAEEVVLSLDEVSLEGYRYVRRFIEIEARHGGGAAVQSVGEIVQSLVNVRPCFTGKVTGARAWLARNGARRLEELPPNPRHTRVAGGTRSRS